jgi:phospholipase/carboxylesterase
MSLESIIIEPKQSAQFAVIWLHGLGASGHDFASIVPQLRLPDSLPVRFIFPHAPVRPVTLNMGMPMPAWYDIYGLEAHSQQDDAGINQTNEHIVQLMQTQHEQGIPAANIILAGFSQGGAIALHTGLHYPEKLAGIMALSTYLPLSETFGTRTEEANHATSIFMAHGTGDVTVPLSFAETSKRLLKKHRYPVKWRTYPMQHSVCPEELRDISAWIQSCFQTIHL